MGAPFIAFSNHKALRGAFEMVDIHGRLARWLDFMAEYAFEIHVVNGDRSALADYLSRPVGPD